MILIKDVKLMGNIFTQAKKVTVVAYPHLFLNLIESVMLVNTTILDKVNNNKVEVSEQDIQGIVYYIDKTNNVYDTADIVMNRVNPKIIAKYIKNGEAYSIPEFNI